MHGISAEFKTRLRYLVDNKLFKSSAKVVFIGEHETGSFFVLDETCLYPQGGGQPSDKGTIEAKDERTWTLLKAVKQDDHVRHFVSERVGQDMVGQEVTLSVDPESRRINSASHTAGHLLAHLVERMSEGSIVAIKGHHFPDEAYVEFRGDMPKNMSKEAFLDWVKSELQSALKSHASVKSELLSPAGGMPTPKSLRTIEIYGVGKAPCGGTHLQNLGELSQVLVKKMKASKSGFRISYGVSLH